MSPTDGPGTPSSPTDGVTPDGPPLSLGEDALWLQVLSETLLNGVPPLTILKDGSPLAVLPFSRLKGDTLIAGTVRAGAPAIAGVDSCAGWVHPVIPESHRIGVLLQRLSTAARWDLFSVPRAGARTALVRALTNSRAPHAFSDAGSCAFCDVSHPDALKATSKDNLRNVDRLRRRAEKDYGDLALEPLTDAAQLHTNVFDRFVALEDAGWKGTNGAGTSLASDARARAFFREVMRRFGEDHRARIDFLTINGRDAAAQLMVRAGPTWFLLKIGYHPDFKDVGPGGILLKAFLEEMVANPDILEVNLTTNPPWAARWHFQTEPVYHVYIYNTTWRGRLLYAARSVKELAKRFRDAYQTRRQTPKLP